jgi:hypothetical protein
MKEELSGKWLDLSMTNPEVYVIDSSYISTA